MVFVFCSYGALVAPHRVPGTRPDAWLPLSWIALAIAIGILALICLRRPAAVSVLLVASAAFAAPPVVRIATAFAGEHRAQAVVDGADGPSRRRLSPDIYWIVLDGYPRQDVLQDVFAFDDSSFIRSLTALDFIVLGKSRANFPITINSISSTLNMDYTIQGDGAGLKPFPEAELYSIIKGKSRAVARLKALGYSYVHFENGYDYLTGCGAEEAKCVHGNTGLDELDTAILSNTPIIDLILHWDNPEGRLEAATFAWGGVADLTSKLDEIRRTRAPFFLYAHIMAPHPPMRFHADCSFRFTDPDLQGWNAAARPAFIEQLNCVNTQTLTMLGRLLQSDPGALVALQSDHGTAFNGQFNKPPADWSDDDLHERFGALNALRLPAPCRASAAADLTLVDTFPLILSCLTGDEFKRHTPRFFVTPYDNSEAYGHAYEYAADRIR
ncbi:sulfatase-like hydrolase/transferase [Bradyrhizobium lablabi]|uniref:sulfatase-like hydrolase/transferase n=1 Tax=Bradyrhizobium lablabi TaxID=722472 RepID=UPI002013B7E1|nr:sulfatase-like hydrolase/transferase [Bradyrhizobium lablabi]